MHLPWAAGNPVLFGGKQHCHPIAPWGWNQLRGAPTDAEESEGGETQRWPKPALPERYVFVWFGSRPRPVVVELANGVAALDLSESLAIIVLKFPEPHVHDNVSPGPFIGSTMHCILLLSL
ncbi:hypothetical protein V6N11_011286 [Hibiscus sabdariffa]|uniref:Uncharacterized protein n=1 Tax=Hibiscus sabdariffa TaxID=183260 RepID=A0ABR2S7T4_9ROSI